MKEILLILFFLGTQSKTFAEELPPVFKVGSVLRIEFSQTEGIVKGTKGAHDSGTTHFYKVRDLKGKWVHLAIDEYEGLTSDEKEKLLARGVKRWLDVGWLNSDYIVNVITQEDWESQEKRSATD